MGAQSTTDVHARVGGGVRGDVRGLVLVSSWPPPSACATCSVDWAMPAIFSDASRRAFSVARRKTAPRRPPLHTTSAARPWPSPGRCRSRTMKCAGGSAASNNDSAMHHHSRGRLPGELCRAVFPSTTSVLMGDHGARQSEASCPWIWYTYLPPLGMPALQFAVPCLLGAAPCG
jgi:hypothetical protein